MGQRWRGWLWLLLGIGLFSGCITVSTKIGRTGRGWRAVEVEVTPAQNAEAVQSLLRAKLGRSYRTQMAEMGTDRKVVRAFRRFRHLGEVGHGSVRFLRPQGGWRRLLQVRTEYTETLRLHSLLISPEEREMAAKIPVRFRLRLPGRFVPQETNASSYEEGWAVWEFPLAEAEGKQLRAVSVRWNYVTLPLSLLVLLVVGYLSLPLWTALARRLRPRPLTPEERAQREEARRQRALERERRRQEAKERRRKKGQEETREG